MKKKADLNEFTSIDRLLFASLRHREMPQVFKLFHAGLFWQRDY